MWTAHSSYCTKYEDEWTSEETKKWLLENEDKWFLFDRDYLESLGINVPEEQRNLSVNGCFLFLFYSLVQAAHKCENYVCK
jgi:hypothetical protein